MRNERASFACERRERIVRRFSAFASGWAGILALWLGVFALDGRLTGEAFAAAGAMLAALAVTGRFLTATPAPAAVLPATVAACIGLGLGALWLGSAGGASGEVIAFLLLALDLLAALVFAWGWPAEFVVVVSTLVPYLVVRDRLPQFVPPLEFGAAVASGSLIALGIAEALARDIRQVMRRRLAQEEALTALQTSRDAYRDLAERMPDMIWRCDLEGRLTYVNEAFGLFFGRPRTDIVGRRADDHWTAHAANPVLAALLAAPPGADTPLRVQCRTPRGPRWVEVRISPVEDEDGTVTGFRGVSRDIQERYDAEEALRASEERFRSSFDHASIGMVVVSLDGCIMEANRAFAAMLGHASQDLIGRRMETLAHPADVAPVRAEVQRLATGAIRSFEIEKRYLHRDGHVVWSLLACSLTRDTRDWSGHVIAQVQDVSARKAAEQALRESEARYRGLVESQHELIVRLDSQGRFTFINEAYAAAVGQPAAALLGVSFVGFVHPDDHPRVADMISTMMQPPHRAYVEVRNYMTQGERWIGWEAGVVVDEAGRIFEAQAIGRDVTEQHETTAALQASVAELRQSEERLRLLARRLTAIREEERKRLGFDLHDDVCQELTGVGILVGSLRLKVGSVPPEVDAEFARVGSYIDEVVEHLRVVARELRPLLLREVGLVGGLRALAAGVASSTLAVSVDLGTRIPRLDEETEISVYRIAQEALTNAVRHAGAATIVVALTAADGILSLSVRDDGCGFDPAARPATALGLASMEERALALGGRLDVRSEPGTGTTVALSCPVAARRPGPLTEPAGSSPTRSSSRPSGATTPPGAVRD